MCRRRNSKWREVAAPIALAASLSACDEPTIYMNDVTENTLGYPYAQFSEAYLVANSRARDPDELLRMVRAACAKFPNLDSYLVRVFADAKWASSDAYDWDFPPMMVAMPKGLADAYLAEINPGKGLLTLYPFKYPPVTVAISRDWCREPQTQAATRVADPPVETRPGSETKTGSEGPVQTPAE
jgi:hypothetical protein